MASTFAVPKVMPAVRPCNRCDAFFKPLPVRPSKEVPMHVGKLEVRASTLKEKAVIWLKATGLTASMIIPEMAEAAIGITPSLEKFLQRVMAGGVVLAAIGVANFDPVKWG